MFLIQQCWLWGEACSQRHVEYKSSSLPLKSWKDVAPCPIQLKNNEKAEHYPWLRIVKNILLLELHWIQQGTLIFGHHRSSPNSARKEQACGFVQVFVQADPLVRKRTSYNIHYLLVSVLMHIIKSCLALQQNLHNKIKKHSQPSCQSPKRLNILSAAAPG